MKVKLLENETGRNVGCPSSPSLLELHGSNSHPSM